MRLTTELKLEQARLKTVKVELSQGDPKITVCIRTSLTQDVAEAFGCRELIYAGNVPRSGVEKMVLEGDEPSCEILLQNDNYSFHATAESIGHYIAKMEGEGPILFLDLKFLGYAGILTDLVERVKLDPLLVVLKPAQSSLELQEEKPTAAPAAEPICESCESGVALLDGTLMHADGKVCIARQAAVQDEPVRPADGSNGDLERLVDTHAALASAAEMGETKRRRGRAKAAGEESVPEPDFMESIQ